MGAVAHDLPYRMCLPAICGVGRGGEVAQDFPLSMLLKTSLREGE